MHHFPIPIVCDLTDKEKWRIDNAAKQLPIWDKFLANLIKNGDIVIDLGANIGLYSLHYLFLGAIVHGFEPSPFNHPSIECICGGFRNFILHRVAVGIDDEITTMRFPDCHDGQNAEQKIIFVRFDEYIAKNGIKPNFIKMDIEGMEHYALHTMTHTIQVIKPCWQIEYHPNFDFWSTYLKTTLDPFDFNMFFDNYTAFNQKLQQVSKISKYGQYFFIPKNHAALTR